MFLEHIAGLYFIVAQNVKGFQPHPKPCCMIHITARLRFKNY